MNKFMVLVIGVIIGAGGMWYMQKSGKQTLQVDEVIDTYSAPMTSQGHNNNAPSNNQGNGNMNNAPATENKAAPTTTGSIDNQLNLSDASDATNMNNDMQNMNNDMQNMNQNMDNMNQNMDNMNNDMQHMNNGMQNMDNGNAAQGTTTNNQGAY